MAMLMPRRFTVDEYERMAASGILYEDDRLELVAGEIIELSPIGARHMNGVNHLTRILSRLLPDDVLISVQNPIRLSNNSQPQPDIAIIYDRKYQTMPNEGHFRFIALANRGESLPSTVFATVTLHADAVFE